MRTWDVLGAPNVFDACPTLAASVANMAIRAAEGLPDPALFNSLGSTDRTRFATFDATFAGNGFPSYEETVDAAEPLIRAQYLTAPDELIMTDALRVRRALDTRIRIFNELTANDDSEPPFSLSLQGTLLLEGNRDQFTQAVAGVMQRPDSRRSFMDAIADRADQDSADLLQSLSNGPVEFDYVVRGDGVHATNQVMTIQECDPDATILVLSNRQNGRRLGSQFRDYGEIPTFEMNNSNRGVFDVRDVYGIPKQGGNLASFGLHAALQVSDFVGTERATNVDTAHGGVANLGLSGAKFVFTNDVNETYSSSTGGADLDSTSIFLGGRPFPVVTRGPIIEAGGIGTPDQDFVSRTGVLTAGDVLRAYGTYDRTGPHPAAQFAGRSVLLAGCGDSAKCAAILLMGQGPREAYDGWSVQSGRLPRLFWVANEFLSPDFATKRGFQANTRSLYAKLARYMPEVMGDDAPITPIGGQLTGVSGRTSTLATVTGENGRLTDVTPDTIVQAIGVTNPNAGAFGVSQMVTFGDTLTDRFGRPYSKQPTRAYVTRYLSSGPVVALPVRDNAGVPENTAAMWSYSPAATLTAYEAVRRKRAREAAGSR